jgi:hypothetical protein
MQNVVTIGKRLVPLEQIALVEPFDPASNPDFKSAKPFKARIVLLNRDTMLTEIAPQEFVDAHGFRILADDQIAVNPLIAFRVEAFEPTEAFKPAKAYRSRLKWHDPESGEHSKLVLTEPPTVIAVAVRGGEEPSMRVQAQRPPRARSTRRGARKLALARS